MNNEEIDLVEHCSRLGECVVKYKEALEKIVKFQCGIELHQSYEEQTEILWHHVKLLKYIAEEGLKK